MKTEAETRRADYLRAAHTLRALNVAISQGSVSADAIETLQVLDRTLKETDEWSYEAMMGAVQRAETALAVDAP